MTNPSGNPVELLKLSLDASQTAIFLFADGFEIELQDCAPDLFQWMRQRLGKTVLVTAVSTPDQSIVFVTDCTTQQRMWFAGPITEQELCD